MRKLCQIGATALALIFLNTHPAGAQQSQSEGAITNGRRTEPGIEASATIPGYETVNTPIESQASYTPASPSTADSVSDGPLIVGLSAHNCTPYTTSAGIGLGLDLGDAGGGDCLSFSVPEPVQQLADRSGPRGRRDQGPSLEELIRSAADRAMALAGQPEIAVAPDGVGLTGLPSYFWLAEEPAPISATASAGGITVTAEAFPVQYMWRFGDGGDLVTFTSGRPWTRELPGDIEHTYEIYGRYTIAVAVTYQARWSVGGGVWQPLGFFSTSDSRTYPVRQVVAVLVRDRTDE